MSGQGENLFAKLTPDTEAVETGYYVETWDHDLREFTPHVGLHPGPHTKWGLRRALRRLQAAGYDTNRRGAWAVLVEKRKVLGNGAVAVTAKLNSGDAAERK